VWARNAGRPVAVKFSFVVGDEKHRVDFSFNQFLGNWSISVDGVRRKRGLRVISMELVKKYELRVGDAEQYNVVIEKERKLLFAGFRKQKYRVFVDDQLVHEDEGF
jgi:hypothetical protein